MCSSQSTAFSYRKRRAFRAPIVGAVSTTVSADNLIAGEKLCDFDRGRFRGIGTMDRVFADGFRVQLADRALIRLRGIGRAHDIAVLQHCMFALENLDHVRTGNDEINLPSEIRT